MKKIKKIFENQYYEIFDIDAFDIEDYMENSELIDLSDSCFEDDSLEIIE
jgi:hypothetical protein